MISQLIMREFCNVFPLKLGQNSFDPDFKTLFSQYIEQDPLENSKGSTIEFTISRFFVGVIQAITFSIEISVAKIQYYIKPHQTNLR